MEEQCKAILLPPKIPDCFFCWETLQILIARHLAKEADRLIADLHLSPLSSRSDTPVYPHFFVVNYLLTTTTATTTFLASFPIDHTDLFL